MLKRLLVPGLLAFCAAASASERVTTPRLTIKPHGAAAVSVQLPDLRTGVIVEFRTHEALSRFRADVTRLAASRTDDGPPRIVREFSAVFDGAAVEVSRAGVASLRALPYVRSVYPDRVVHALAAEQPGISAVRAPEVWKAFNARGRGITIAIIDTGIDYRHPALGGGFGPSFKVAGGYDFVDQDDDPMDENGHGTHVAGIVAADSPELRGVAPEATLVAYRVLDKGGQGKSSDVIAAIERAVDPNGDGDTSDHVLVMNLSLGSDGGPGDPTARAVNAAVEAGVVVCAAAGNDGKYGSIESPGAAARAITVGASGDDGNVAAYSSAGPNDLTYDIKPDLLAPGSDVLSCLRNGGYGAMSGTSMAAPHVAGIAALLRQIHPEWTPDTVKSALIHNATAIAGPIMQTGSGGADALHAAGAQLFASPASINFGVTDGTANVAWTRAIMITNGDASAQDVSLNVTGTSPAVEIAVEPAIVTIPAGESRQVQLTLTVVNASVPFETSFSRGGIVEIHVGGDVQRISWAFVKGLRLRLSTDTDAQGAIATGDGLLRYDLRPAGDDLFETLVKPGTFDVTVYGYDSRSTTAPFFFAAFEQQAIGADRTFTLRSSDIRHRVSFRGVDHAGVPVAPPQPTRRCFGHRTLELPPGSAVDYIRASGSGMQGVMTTALGERYVITGGDVCRTNDLLTLDVLHYATLHGVSGDVERWAGGQLRPQNVSLHFPPFASGSGLLVLTAAAYTPGDRADFGFVEPWSDPVWNGEVYLEESDDTENATWAALEAQTSTPYDFGYVQPLALRAVNGNIASCNSRPLPPNAHLWSRDETMSFGNGYAMLRPFFWSDGSNRLTIESTLAGAGEERRYPFAAPVTKLLDASGNVVGAAGFGTQIDLSAPLTLVVESDGYLLEGMRGKSTYTATLTAAKNDSIPPIFTSLLVLDSSASPAMHLRQGSSASMRFSAMDYATNNVSAHIADGSLRAFYRQHGTSDWKPLAPAKIGEDYGSNADLKRDPMGSMYEVSLREATSAGPGFYDVRFAVDDLSGNSSETTIEPAFVVDGLARLHGVRR